MDKSLAISLIKAGNLNPGQIQAIVNSVDYADRAEVLACVKGGDAEGAALGAILQQILPGIVKAAVKSEIKKAGFPPKKKPAGASGGSSSSDGTSGASSSSEGTSGASSSDGTSGASSSEASEVSGKGLKAMLNKLDDILDHQESPDPELQKVMKEAGACVPNYADLQKKWEDGTLDDAELKQYMKLKTSVRKKARATLKSKRLKEEKEAINELSASQAKDNQDGNMGESGFDKVKKMFETDREITDPEEITKLMAIAQNGVDAGVL